MRSYDAFFFGAFFFLLGVLAASLPAGPAGEGAAGMVWWVVLGGTVSALVARWRQGRGWHFTRWERNGWFTLAALLLFVPAGAFFYAADAARFTRTPLPEGERTFAARVVSLPVVKEGTQEAVFALEEHELRVVAKLPAYPTFSYGDRVTFTGRVEEPFSDSYLAYLAKERVRGVVAFPEIATHEPAVGWSFRGALYALRARIVDAFRRTLPAKEASLMAGITVGAREDFSREFRDAMAQSGTTHITALSGYNISVVIYYVLAGLLFLLPRRIALVATLLAVLAFVLMTGAEASVVRAAVMGSIVLLGKHAGRRVDTRNVIALAALLMVLANPKVLAFDLGFQLSFLALLGIVYLKPALDALLGWQTTRDAIVLWRENLTTTVAAQVAVAPLLIHAFGSVSASSIVANLLVLEVVPLTMGLGFILAGVSLVSFFLAQLLAFVPLLFLKFQTLVIEFFAAVSFPVAPTLSLGTVVFYYGVLGALIFYHVHRNRFRPHQV